MNMIELYTIAFGDYWEKYSKVFYRNYNNLNTKPHRVVVYTDKLIDDLPKGFENVVVDEKDYQHLIDENSNYKIGIYRQTAVDHAKCDWLVNVDIDDLIFPNFLDSLNKKTSSYNLISRSFLSSHPKLCEHSKETYKTYSTDLKNNLNDYWNKNEPSWCFHNCHMIKTEIAKKIGYLKNNAHKGFEDCNFWINFINQGYHTNVYFDNTPTFFYYISSNGENVTPHYHKKIYQFNIEYFNKIKKERNAK